jgi:hypothetical protein
MGLQTNIQPPHNWGAPFMGVMRANKPLSNKASWVIHHHHPGSPWGLIKNRKTLWQARGEIAQFQMNPPNEVTGLYDLSFVCWLSDCPSAI